MRRDQPVEILEKNLGAESFSGGRELDHLFYLTTECTEEHREAQLMRQGRMLERQPGSAEGAKILPVQVESAFDIHFDPHSMSFALRWLETPFLNGIHGFLVEALAKRTKDANLPDLTCLVYKDR